MSNRFATSLATADAIAAQLSNRKNVWLQVSVVDRITYLQRCIDCVMAVAPAWAEAACHAKSIEPTAHLAGEEWLIGPTATVAHLRLLIKTLEANGQPPPVRLRTHNGQSIAQVFPAHWMDRLLWRGFVGEVWLQPGQPPTQGMVYRQTPTKGTLALVLGAGNVSSIAPLDALYKLFAEDAVVLVKMNPVNEYMGPILEAAFQPLCEAGFFAIVYGGAALGQRLCQHPLVDTIHITGSHHTHDTIVWGETAAEQSQCKAIDQPLTAKPITSELGCVTPVIVVPGAWSNRDIAIQARHLAGMVAHNASFNCAAAKVVILAKGWAHRGAFLTRLQEELTRTPLRNAYYPGAQQRYRAFLERYPQAIALGGAPEQDTENVVSLESALIPWTLIPDVPAIAEEYALTHEAFCGVLAEVSLEAADTGEFLRRSTAFVNEHVWGNLSCTVLVAPQTQRQWHKELESAIAQLRYGVIGVNVWSGVLFSLTVFPWGAFPGNTLKDIRSGHGTVHNAYLFEQPQKSVLYAPFRIMPVPVWFARHRNLLSFAQRFTDFQANPSWQRLLRAILAALQG